MLDRMANCGVDLVSEVPFDRWPVGVPEYTDNVVGERSRHGGFLSNAELFDNVFFGVPPAEASSMDPQQRLLLEYGYASLHGAALQRSLLLGSLTGVFLGIAASDHSELVRSNPALRRNVYSATGSSHSIACGRISFVLGMHGPCVSVDTACSAALVANHSALRALQLQECPDALSVGVSMMLLPGVSIVFANAGMLSAHGRCQTFDARADGYARAEACCAVTLRTRGVGNGNGTLLLVGSSVRQDGKSASLTAPNGQAQQGLLRASLIDAAMDSTEVATIEAHGTGTALGDPIEARTVAVLQVNREASEALAMCSVKANAGHSEPCAGASGLLKICASVRRVSAAPNAQLRSINPHVDGALRGVACVLPIQQSVAPVCAAVAVDSRVGGVNCFGYSGTIAHALVCSSTTESTSLGSELPSLIYRKHRYPWPRIGAKGVEKSSFSSEGASDKSLSLAQLDPIRELSRPLASDMTVHAIQETLLEEVRAFIVGETLDFDVALDAAGLDSMAFIELRNRVDERLGVRLGNEDLLSEGSVSIAYLSRRIAELAARSSDHDAAISTPVTSVMNGMAAPIPVRLQRPILFILSCPRSGSSLLQLCLQVNAALYAGQELYLLLFDTLGERAANPDMKHLSYGLVQTFAEVLGVSHRVASARVELFGADCPTWQVYEALQRMVAFRILVDKTPAYAYNVNIMYRSTEIFVASRYIHLIRHPYSCIASWVELMRDTLNVSGTTWTSVEQAWVASQSACDEFMDFLEKRRPLGLHQTPSMLLRYEDFLRDPAGITRSVCESLLNIKWTAEMASPYQTTAIESFRSNGGFVATNDLKLLKRKRIEPEQADKWREVHLPQPLLEATKQLAMARDYELLPDPTPELIWITQPLRTAVGPPVVCVHDFTGQLWGFRALAPLISETGCIGVRCTTRLLDGCTCMQDVAARYIELLPMGLWRKRQPLRIVAYSLGCHIGYWMACMLEAQGRPTELVLLDGPVGGGNDMPPRMGGYAAQVVGHLRKRLGLPRSNLDTESNPSEPLAFTASKAGGDTFGLAGRMQMLFNMLEDAGAEATHTVVQLIEMPDIISRPLGPIQSPVLLIHTKSYRDNGNLDVTTKLIPHLTVHQHEGKHFSFLLTGAEDVARAISRWLDNPPKGLISVT
jgi:3-oxoacyl-(acyl-carrier-protein) synthase/acyl carrier protein